jgi:hypothetical protein
MGLIWRNVPHVYTAAVRHCVPYDATLCNGADSQQDAKNVFQGKESLDPEADIAAQKEKKTVTKGTQMAMVMVPKRARDAGWSGSEKMLGGGFSAGVNVGSEEDEALVILSSAFGGLLTTGIANMDGTSGKNNWRWVFIFEGILTCLVPVAAYFFINDFPSESKWLSETERQFILAKTGEQENGDDKITGKDLLKFFKEPTNYLGALMYFGKANMVAVEG